MTKFRFHRQLLVDSLETEIEVSSLAEIMDALDWYEEIDTVDIQQYAYDARIDWDTYVVLVNGIVAGFTDGPL